jgi:soluble cytochrome b562
MIDNLTSPAQLPASPEGKIPDNQRFQEVRIRMMENLPEIVDKIIAEAKAGNIQAAKFLYPFLSDLVGPEEETDILQELEGDGDQRWA